MPYPSRILDTDELTALFEDHTECIYLGPWKELTLGPLKLVRRDDGGIEVQELEEDFGSL